MIDSKIKLLQLRKLRNNPGLIVKLDGPLLSKGGSRSRSKINSIKEQIQQATKRFCWSPLPRARVAVSFQFFAEQQDPPEIYRNIKYYLDLLQGPAFKDDRQVYYLDASIWRTKPKSKEISSTLFIHVRRLRDYLQMLDLYKEDDSFNHRDDNDIFFPDLILIDKNLRGKAEKQYNFLRSSRIMLYDLPQLKNTSLSALAQNFNKIHPLVFDFSSLPRRRQSQYFQNIIASSFSDFITTYPVFKQMLIPIEFDVKVKKTGLKLGKDLDNIMITICREVRKQVLSSNAYVNGYRIYVVDKSGADIKSDIQVKLLPPGEIEYYNNRLNEVLSATEEKLNDNIWL